MIRTKTLTTRLPAKLKGELDQVCRQFGLKKNFVVEQTLREKLEDLLDTFDLKRAVKTGTGFRPLEDVVKDLKRRRKL